MNRSLHFRSKRRRKSVARRVNAQESRLGGARPSYIHPSTVRVLGSTAGQLLYVDQLVELLKGLGFEHGWAEQFRRPLGSGRRIEQRTQMEQVLRAAASKQGWTAEQTTSLLGLLYEHVGYLYNHGHALQLARRAYEQACLKVSPRTVAAFFAEVLNNGGSTHYGLGAAVEEARQWGVTLLPPSVQQSTDRYVVEDAPELPAGIAGAVRVPLTAIRGLSPHAVRHILIARKAFGGFLSLLDFCRKVDRTIVTRQDLLLLIKLGAFAWTGLSRGQLAFAEQYYAGAAELLRAADRDPGGAASIEDALTDSNCSRARRGGLAAGGDRRVRVGPSRVLLRRTARGPAARETAGGGVWRGRDRRAGRLSRPCAGHHRRDRDDAAGPHDKERRGDGVGRPQRRHRWPGMRGVSEGVRQVEQTQYSARRRVPGGARASGARRSHRSALLRRRTGAAGWPRSAPERDRGGGRAAARRRAAADVTDCMSVSDVDLPALLRTLTEQQSIPSATSPRKRPRSTPASYCPIIPNSTMRSTRFACWRVVARVRIRSISGPTWCSATSN